MAYQYRKVKCLWCGHVFMWNMNSQEGLALHEYQIKETGEFVEKTSCPKCYEIMVVLNHVLEGIDINDARIIKRSIRGV